jgi:hypothetical protein
MNKNQIPVVLAIPVTVGRRYFSTISFLGIKKKLLKSSLIVELYWDFMIEICIILLDKKILLTSTHLKKKRQQNSILLPFLTFERNHPN